MSKICLALCAFNIYGVFLCVYTDHPIAAVISGVGAAAWWYNAKKHGVK